MEKPIFSTVNGLMEYRKQNEKIIKICEKARKALVFSISLSPIDIECESKEVYLMTLVREIEALVKELKSNESG